MFVWLKGSPGDGRGEKRRMNGLFSQVSHASLGSVVTRSHEKSMCACA